MRNRAARARRLRHVDVNLGARSYRVHIGAGAIERLGDICAALGFRRAALISEPRIGALHGDRALASLHAAGIDVAMHLFPLDEAHKSLTTVEAICNALLDAGHRRGDAIVALGGGVVCDTAGFAAAMLLRGVPLVQVPTTIVAQADASVGGKVGVDARQGKNLLGAFFQPRAVVSDTALLSSLDSRERWSGLAEVVKCALIAPGPLLELVERSLEDFASSATDPAEAIALAVEIKARIVEGDEQESGVRAFLNFGHTIGHALETAGDYRRYRHGEAVALGMRAGIGLSRDLGSVERKRAIELVKRIAITPGPRVDFPRARAALAQDKKRGNTLRYVVLQALGHPGLREVSEAESDAALAAAEME